MQKHETELGRFYQTPIGSLPSVNTIIRHTRPKKQQDKLQQWRDLHGHEQKTSRQRGTFLHQQIENYFHTGKLPEQIETDNNISNNDSPTEYWSGICKTLIGHPSTTYKLPDNELAIEYATYHPELKYAGTLDWLGEWNGRLTLIDFKTSSRPKLLKYLKEYRLQLAAYKLAVEHHFDIDIPQTAIVIFVKNQSSQIFYFSDRDLESDVLGWQKRVNKYYRSPLNFNL